MSNESYKCEKKAHVFISPVTTPNANFRAKKIGKISTGRVDNRGFPVSDVICAQIGIKATRRRGGTRRRASGMRKNLRSGAFSKPEELQPCSWLVVIKQIFTSTIIHFYLHQYSSVSNDYNVLLGGAPFWLC